MKRIFFVMSMALGLVVVHGVYAMQQEQLSVKPIMPQQQLLAQKEALQAFVKQAWNECLTVLKDRVPDVVQENPSNELSIAHDFEKLQGVDDNIFLIREIVHDVITQDSVPFMHFDKRTKVVQEQILKQMLERMISNVLIELLVQDVSKSLNWCGCLANYKRITLAILVVNEAREKYPNTNQRIVYTSLASGNLLQDYVILSELAQSHTNILVNLIDLDYPDIFALSKRNVSTENPQDVHALSLKTHQEMADSIDSFKIKMGQIISTRPAGSDYNFEVNVYNNAYEYIARVQKNSDEKSNILILTDPSTGSFGIADYPSLANVINIWGAQEEAPIFTLYIPRHQGVQLYELITSNSEESSSTSERIVHYIRNQLMALITQTGANKHYTPRLTQAFLDRINIGTQVSDDVLERIGFSKLAHVRSNLRKQELKYGYLDYGTGNLLQPLTPIKLGNAPVLLSWGSDAHITFQDLVWDAMVPNAIIYQLYGIDPLEGTDKNNVIVKVYPEVYKNLDVITPNSGRASSDIPLLTDFEEEQEQNEQWPQEEQIEEDFQGNGNEDIDETVEPEEYYAAPSGKYKRII